MLPSPVRGRGAGGEGGKRFADPFQHRVRFVQDFVVPEAQHGVTPSSKPGVAFLVFGAAVLPAVRFDDQSMFHAYEINDVWANGFLAFEFKTA